MIFRYNEPLYRNDVRVPTNPGTTVIDDFILVHPSTGGVKLKKKGTIPLYAKIQAAKVNCDLQAVLEACVHQNQLSVVTADDVKTAIADFTGLSSMSEWYAGMKHLENTWEDLPVDVREQFNSSPANFVNAIGQLDFIEKVEKGFDSYYGAMRNRIDVKPEKVQVDVPNDLPDVKPDVVPDDVGGDK